MGGAFRQVKEWGLLCVRFLVVRLGGGHAVAEHFLDIAVGHVHRHDFLSFHIVIVPEFKVVLVAPLVVHPCEAHARVAALAVVRRFLARVIFGARDKFAGTVLRQIVEQSLQPDTGLKAKSNDLVSMLCNRNKMLDRMEHARKIVKKIKFSLKVVKKWSFGEGYTVWFCVVDMRFSERNSVFWRPNAEKFLTLKVFVIKNYTT